MSRAALVLAHGASVGVDSKDLVAARTATRAEGVSVALLEQPYWVAGRRAPAPASQLDIDRLTPRTPSASGPVS